MSRYAELRAAKRIAAALLPCWLAACGGTPARPGDAAPAAAQPPSTAALAPVHLSDHLSFRRLGFPVDPHTRRCDDLEQAVDFCAHWTDHRDDLDYEIDGVVLKIDGFGYQEALGFVSNAPRWAVAFKFPAEQKTTRLKKIAEGARPNVLDMLRNGTNVDVRVA